MDFNRTFDLCVIGSGPAGIITVLEFCRLQPDRQVLLVEFGSKSGKKNSLDDTIKILDERNHHKPYDCTNKGIGGTSLTWGGRCVMYDDIDFRQRPIIGENCTWTPDILEKVRPYLSVSARYFECGQTIFDMSEIKGREQTRISGNFKQGIVTDTGIERWSRPTRFGTRYKDDLAACKNLTVVDGFQAIAFGNPDYSGHVSTLTIRSCSSGDEFQIRSSNFVVAAGGQESTRLMLKNQQIFSRLGKVPESLGKYYQGHLHGKIASVLFSGDPKRTEFGFVRDQDGIYIKRRLQFEQDFLFENNLLNTCFWLDNPLYNDPGHRNGAMSMMYLAMVTPFLRKRLAPPVIADSITKGSAKNIKAHCRNVLRDFPKSFLIPLNIFIRRYLFKRKLPGIFLYSPKNQYSLNFHSEQIPLKSNRMELSEDGSTLKINYEFSDEDVQSVIRTHESLDSWLRETGAGKLLYWYPKDSLPEKIKEICKDGVHQIGTTRIGRSPEHGVVDQNLKVWGTNNIFICSSSVFPTSGQANPTFFLGAFAARLAHYLSTHEAN